MIGHHAARAQLESYLPQVTLLTGPASIGKHTLALHLLRVHLVHPADQVIVDTVSMDTVRTLSGWASKAPYRKVKAAVITLDSASEQTQNALLKLLEEPPAKARFILVSSGHPLPTLASRCTRFQLGYLTPGETSQVLVQLGIPIPRAKRAAVLAGGQVATGQRIDTAGTEAWSSVVALMRSISLADRDGFHKATLAWDLTSANLLSTWFTEAITHHYAVFSTEETFGLEADRTRLLDMVTALSRVGSANPRLAARAALEPFLGG